MIVGLIAGLGAIFFQIVTQAVFYYVMERVVGYHPVKPTGEPSLAFLPETFGSFHPILLLVVPTIGGILSGLIVFLVAPEAEGHGTDAVIAAYHYHQGQIRARVPMVKTVASAITIGTGGSGGREGPIAQIAAGFASLLSRLMKLRPAEARVLLAAGMGAGIAAIFRAPLAGALFAAEVLYWSPEFEAEVILPAGIASVVSYSCYGARFGWAPLFTIPELAFDDPRQLGPYFLLAIFVIILAFLYTHTFYGVTRLFHGLKMPRALKPAVGAFVTGAIGLGLYYLLGKNQHALAVLSFGYGAIQDALVGDGGDGVVLLLAIALGKILTTSMTIGSGGSAGVFGPSMVIGGCGGGALGVLFHQWWPALVPHPASFVIVGMAGFFAAAAKTPFSTLVIVSEMTGGYHLLLPSLWVCLLSFMLSDRLSIYTSQVETRSRSPAHKGAYIRDVLDGVQVNRFLQADMTVPVLHRGDSLATVLERLDQSRFPVLPVVDGEDRLLGVVNLEEAHLASTQPMLGDFVVVDDLMRSGVVPLTPDDQLDRAMELFIENDLLALPIVNDILDKKILGMVRRFDIASEYLRLVHESRS